MPQADSVARFVAFSVHACDAALIGSRRDEMPSFAVREEYTPRRIYANPQEQRYIAVKTYPSSTKSCRYILYV